MRHTQIYRSGRGRSKRPRPVRVQALDDRDRDARAACGCLMLAAVVLVGLLCGGASFLAVLLLDW